MSKSETDELVRLVGLSKRYGAVVANDSIDLSLQRGSILCLVGENGAGKSTLMKMLFGLIKPTAGRIIVRGEERRWRSPLEAMRQGIGMVHQHFMLVPEASVLDNVLVGTSSGWLQGLKPLKREVAAKAIAQVATQYGLDVPLHSRLEDLPLGVWQKVEILKALYRKAEVLILDEPTAVLTPLETRELFANLKTLAAKGCSIVVITHKLEEVLALADRIAILRAGRIVGHADPKVVSVQQLASLMVGKEVNLRLAVSPAKPLKDKVLELSAVQHADPRRLSDINLSVAAGEIVGVAGVEGNGQSELLEAILKASLPAHRARGQVRILGADATRLTPRQILDLGVGVIPFDRHAEGLLLASDARANCLLGHERQAALSQGGWLKWSKIEAMTRRIMDDFAVTPVDSRRLAKEFSGGNQQKLIIGRELAFAPRLLLAACPTRGVDVGAIELIHKRLVAARDAGLGVLMISSDLDEVMTLSDRIVVLYRGRLVAEFKRGAADINALGAAMGGSAHV